MKEILKKIVGMDLCEAFAEVYQYVVVELDKLDQQLDNPAAVGNLGAFYDEVSKIEVLLNVLQDNVINFSLKEYERIEGKLYEDYYAQIGLLAKYLILDETGKSYQADYGRHAGQKFAMPDIREVFSGHNRRIYWFYKRMEAAGLQPRLQLTPIGYKIDTLVRKIWPDRSAVSFGGFFSEGILRYQPDSVSISPDRPDHLEIRGGLSKNQWVAQHKGWIVELVPTRSVYVYDNNGQDSVQKYVRDSLGDMQRQLLKPMTVETFLISKLSERDSKSRSEEFTSDLLLGAFIPKQPMLLGATGGGKKMLCLELEHYEYWRKLACRVNGTANIANF